MLYVVQHCEAVPKDQDPDRPLTGRGELDARNLAELLDRAAVAVDAIYDSGKLRARQTAEILADQLTPATPREAVDGLGATDPAGPVTERIGRWPAGVLIVSHQPFVGRLTAALLGGDEERPPVAFTPGTAVALQHDTEGGWQIAWMVRPELLR